MPKISLIIVVYNPSGQDLMRIKELSHIYDGVVIDNTQDTPLTNENEFGKMVYLYNGNIGGIAGAQNMGIKYLNKTETEYYVFLDQDSCVDVLYPQHIVMEYINLRKTINNIALLGPTVINKDNDKEYKSVIHKDKVFYGVFIQRRDVISSGCCISKNIMDKIGSNDAKLFIDYVDFEWCWRAESKGYICGITPKITIQHKVGNREISFPFGYKVIISSPKRYFYQYRNYFWLIRRKYVPLQWKFTMGVKYALRFFYFPIFIKKGFTYWKYMVKGIVAGMK